MKNWKQLTVMAIAAIIALTFAFIACGGDDDGNPPQTETYSGTAGGSTYTLKITEAARYVAQVGDSYVLTVTTGGTTKTSSGTVTKSGNELELTPSSPGASSFTVTVSTAGITAMTGTITFTDGNPPQEAPATITAGSGYTLRTNWLTTEEWYTHVTTPYGVSDIAAFNAKTWTLSDFNDTFPKLETEEDLSGTEAELRAAGEAHPHLTTADMDTMFNKVKSQGWVLYAVQAADDDFYADIIGIKKD